MSEFKGIDVSNARGVIDWPTAAASGIDFAIIKAGYGNEPNQIDDMYETNMKGALAAGLHVGIYWMSYARNTDEAKTEARMAIEAAKAFTLSYPIFFDFEGDSVRYAKVNGVNVDKTLVTSLWQAFRDEVKALGYVPGVYSNKDFLEDYYDQTVIDSDYVWVAQYNDTLTYAGKTAIWQHTSTGSTPGVPGNCDCDICYINFPSIINQAAQPSPAPVPAPVPAQPATHDEHIDVFYMAYTAEDGWLPEVKNLDLNENNENGFAGNKDHKIINIAIGVSKGSLKYRVHTTDGRWHDYVTGYDIHDVENGYAGNDKNEIDAVEVYFFTPDDIRPYKRAHYRVAPCSGEYFSFQYDDETGDNPEGKKQDGYAGMFGNPISRFQIEIV